MASGSTKAVYAAIVANSILTVVKFGGFLISGSASMLSEAIHSATDASNQGLLALGIHRSNKEASEDHPYGHGRERYVWALISAVGIFFLGCGLTLYHGVLGLIHPHAPDNIGTALAILGFAAVLEGLTLWVAIKEVRKMAVEEGMTFREYVRSGSDPMAVAVLLEDGAAEIGVILAASCLGMAKYTGNPRWDAVGSIVVGLILGMVAIFLIMRSSEMLVGKSAPDLVRQRLERVLEDSPVVDGITDVRAIVQGADDLRFKVEVDFNGAELAHRYLDSLAESDPDRLARWTGLCGTREALNQMLGEFSEELMSFLGTEVDELERKIRLAVPKATHIDIEVDAGE
jgi:zinc transporter 9